MSNLFGYDTLPMYQNYLMPFILKHAIPIIYNWSFIVCNHIWIYVLLSIYFIRGYQKTTLWWFCFNSLCRIIITVGPVCNSKIFYWTIQTALGGTVLRRQRSPCDTTCDFFIYSISFLLQFSCSLTGQKFFQLMSLPLISSIIIISSFGNFLNRVFHCPISHNPLLRADKLFSSRRARLPLTGHVCSS